MRKRILVLIAALAVSACGGGDTKSGFVEPPIPHPTDTSHVATTQRISCKVVAAQATSEVLVSPLRITYTKGNQSISRDVGLDGDCGVESPLALEDSVRIVLDAPAGTTRVYHPMIAYAAKADLAASGGITLIAIPFRYQITGGDYAGQSSPIDLNLAYTGGTQFAASVYDGFYPRGPVQRLDGRMWYSNNTFPASALPQPVSLLVQPERISSAGVNTITTGLESLKSMVGWNITQSPVVKDTAFWAKGAVVVTIDPSKCTGEAAINACAGTNLSGSDIDGGAIVFMSKTAITPHIVLHEMIHVLGFGHGCAWPSAMNQYCAPASPYATPTDMPTLQDIGYIQLKYRIRDLERKYNTLFSLGESHQGERVLMLGLPEELTTKVHP